MISSRFIALLKSNCMVVECRRYVFKGLLFIGEDAFRQQENDVKSYSEWGEDMKNDYTWNLYFAGVVLRPIFEIAAVPDRRELFYSRPQWFGVPSSESTPSSNVWKNVRVSDRVIFISFCINVWSFKNWCDFKIFPRCEMNPIILSNVYDRLFVSLIKVVCVCFVYNKKAFY